MPGLDVPSNVRTEVVYDPVTGMYRLQRYIGQIPLGAPTYMTAAQYQNQVYGQQELSQWSSSWAEGSAADDRQGAGVVPDMAIDNDIIRNIFGSDELEIRPQGAATLKFGLRYQHIDNPIVPERNRSTLAFDFDQDMQINATGKLGDRMDIRLNYDTKATFAFENKMKLNFTGLEDDIVKSLEMGDVSLPTGGSLITGAQSLFGLKGAFQFGKTKITTVAAEQRSQSQSINVQGGGSTQEFMIEADDYEVNRHFFLAHYFRDNYERWLETLPVISSPIQITKVELWVTNRRSTTTETRNVLGFVDLGEREGRAWRSTAANRVGESIFPGTASSGLPNNNVNKLHPDELTSRLVGIRNNAMAANSLQAVGYDANIEFAELSNARKLLPNEYTIHNQLGFITLNTALNQDEILAVAFQYTANGRTYQVGEFSNDGVVAPQTLIVKLLKHSTLQVKSPIWDLMMKNVYSLNTFQLAQEDFKLQVMYRNDATGLPIPFLPESTVKDELLVQVLDLDRVNSNGDPFPDGLFDFIPGVTVHTQNGRVILPVLEPFGSSLEKRLNTAEEKKRYVFQQLYDSTLFRAQEMTHLNKFVIKGRYKGSGGSIIQLNAFNIPRGSINVTAGGRQLVENQDYTVDYGLGQVRILNESILSSGLPIKVNFENNSMFNMQTKTFLGTTIEHRISDDWTFGGSFLRLAEQSLPQKVQAGDEPVANNIWGVNTQYEKNLPGLTRALDALPFVSTNAASKIQVNAEFAQLLPGTSSRIRIADEPTTYLDDFESSQTEIDLRGTTTWYLGSGPEGSAQRFAGAGLNNDWASNANRALLSWYIIDPNFYQGNTNTPVNIRNSPAITSEQMQRRVPIVEVFPNVPIQPGMATNIAMFDVQFDPTERGPYNYDVAGYPGISAGINADGSLKSPETRWASMMRMLTINNFEEQNIEFIQFWVMDPFVDNPAAAGGDLYFHLGSLSEDILKDGRQSFEHGLNAQGNIVDLDSSVYGYATVYQPVTMAFDNNPTAREHQDVGLDGLSDGREARWRDGSGQTYLGRLANAFGTSSGAYQRAQGDPAGDNFQYYRGDSLDNANADILRRYRYWNHSHGNSNTEMINGLPATYTNLPDREDVNQDNTLNKSEQYFEYHISMRPEDLVIGQNYVADIYETTTDLLPDNTRKPVRWIQFKIPVFTPDQRVGGMSDYRSIRFMRMAMTGWSEPVVFRFARLELLRGEWRRYRYSLEAARDMIPVDQGDQTVFEVNNVNIEENGGRQPIPYVLPPGIERQQMLGTTTLIQQNENAMSMDVCGLRDGDARAVFKNTKVDMRMNKRLKMFVHAESSDLSDPVQDGDLRAFVRLGNDYSRNYYEYEIPLSVTPWGSINAFDIWPEENQMDVAFETLTELKLERDAAIAANPNVSAAEIYEKRLDNGAYVRVVGSPNLGDVRTIMIGVRNPRKRSVGDGDDGLSKCAEIWVNELRMVDFDNRGGWATVARSTMQLADLGQVAMTGSMSTPGFGSLEMNPQQRNKFTRAGYDLQAQLDLDKFMPGASRLKLPIFVNQSQEWELPMFNPLAPDIEMTRALENLNTSAERDSLRSMTSEFTQRRGVNFSNIRVSRAQGGGGRAEPGRGGVPEPGRGGASSRTPAKGGARAPKPWDIANWSAGYTYNEVLKTDANTAQNRLDDYKGNIAYNFQSLPIRLAPFKNVKGKNLALIRDFNLNLTPSKVSARAEVNRTLHVMEMRNVDNPKFKLPVTYAKNFTMDRNYNVVWDLSKNFKLDYTGMMRVRMDELPGAVGIDSIDNYLKEQIAMGGRPTQYHHTINTSWPVPINKIPYLEFAQLQLRYQGDFDWRAQSLIASVQQRDSLDYGNTIENAGRFTATANLNMNTFYNKFPFYKKVQRLGQPTGRGRGAIDRRSVGGRGNEQMARNPNAKEEEKKGVEEWPGWAQKLLVGTVDFVTMFKSANVSATINTSSLLPGYVPEPKYAGLNDQFAMSPGWDYIFGLPTDIADRASTSGWLNDNTMQPQRYMDNLTRNLNARAVIEPIKDMRITVTAQQNYGKQYSSTYRYSTGSGMDSGMVPGPGYYHFSPNQMETFSTSWLAWSSAFETSPEPEYPSIVYDLFLANRVGNSEDLADWQMAQDPTFVKNFISDVDSSRYGYEGFSVLHSEVLFRSFLQAYGEGYGTADAMVDLKTLPALPNWSLNYTGLMRNALMKQYFTSFSVTHRYSNNLTVSGVQTNMLRAQKIQDNPTVLFPIDANGDILSDRQIGQVSMTESFSPLIGVDTRLKNKASFKLEVGRNRHVALSMANNQITESRSYDFTMGAGYIVKDLSFTMVDQGGQRTHVKSNLELKLDVRIADNQVVIRKLLEGFNQPASGQRRTTIKFTADYRLSSRLNAQFYYDQTISSFKTSMAFPTNQWQSGIALRLNLGA